MTCGWWVPWEHEIFRTYHWTPHVIDACEAMEVFGHIQLLRLRECRDLLWAIRVSSFPHIENRETREGIVRDAEAIGKTSESQRKSAFDVVDDRSRVRMIGAEYSTHGETWARNHPRQIEWLKSQGISLEEAVREFDSWWESRIAEANAEIGMQREARQGFGRSAGNESDESEESERV